MSPQNTPPDTPPRFTPRYSADIRPRTDSTSSFGSGTGPTPAPNSGPQPAPTPGRAAPIPPTRALRIAGLIFPVLVVLAVAALIAGRVWLRHATSDSLPQVDGSLSVPGLSAPVTVTRDAQGVPHLHARTVDDLVLAQGFVTAGDRLFQMDAIRRHAAGELAEVLGPNLLAADRVQRILGIRAAADRAILTLPPDQLHYLELYARGVNASIAAQSAHLPVEFRILRYTPRPWTPRDSLLVSLAMFQDLTDSFPGKLNREALTARLAPEASLELRTELLDDLYPVGSWRDHPPTQPLTDLTVPVPEIEQIPLDESQTKLAPPPIPPPSPLLVTQERSGGICCSGPSTENATLSRSIPHPSSSPERREASVSASNSSPAIPGTAAPTDLLHLSQLLAPLSCPGCQPGSNNWVVAGSRTATGSPLLSNDMHLTHNAPGIWYEAGLSADTSPTGLPFHVAGVSLPGAPFIIVGHNAHVAWGFTNLGADVQDLSVEHLHGTGANAQFITAAGNWQPVLHTAEIIHVHGGSDVTLDVLSTIHGTIATPIISPLFPSETRTVALRWTIYDPDNLTSPFFNVNAATSALSLIRAFSDFGGPAQNLVVADDAGHIGYHATGRIPVRGSLAFPAPLSPVPTDVTSFNALSHEWVGYIPYDQLPQSLDPVGGVLATANARITPDPYLFPITLNWGDPYRNERIWKVLGSHHNLTAADMLKLQGDIYSDPDRVIGQRLAYAIDNVNGGTVTSDAKRLHQVADLLRTWNGNVDSNSPAPAIVDAARAALWPLLLTPKLAAGATHPSTKAGSSTAASGTRGVGASGIATAGAADPWQLYTWGERAYAEEQIVMHSPARWLPPRFATWDDLLVAAVEKGLNDAHAPSDLAHWNYGKLHPVEIEHPIFAQSTLLRRVFGLPVGTGVRPQSGDGTTVKQVARSFGPSERFTADLSDPDNSTLNIVLGESGNPASPWFLNQFPAWYTGTTYKLPFTPTAIQSASTHALTLTP